MHIPEKEYFEKHIEHDKRRKEAYFTQYIKFRRTCIDKYDVDVGAVPMMWIAYQLRELDYDLGQLQV